MNSPTNLTRQVLAVLVPMVLTASTAQALNKEPVHGVAFTDISGAIIQNRTSLISGGDGTGGAAWLDYDRDGDLDLFITSGPSSPSALFRNNGDSSFTDVAVAAGVANGLGSDAAIAADIDNDGYTDLFTTGDGAVFTGTDSPTKLYHNNGDGTFSDITATANVPGSGADSGATFVDIDNDGFVDLFIAATGSLAGQFQTRNSLYLNNGDLTFTDISATAGVDTNLGGCVAGSTDLDQDGWMDIVVGNCNDVTLTPTPIEVFHNNADGTFTDISNTSGLAGVFGLWMGLAFGDYDNNGTIDFFSTSAGIPLSPHALVMNNGDGTFSEQAAFAGVANWEFGWGASAADYDNDGDLDFYTTGSLPVPPFNVLGSGNGFGGLSSSPGRLFFNNGDATFGDPVVLVDQTFMFSSGVAQGDFNGDGFADIVVVVDTIPGVSPGKPILLHNEGNRNHWITVRLVGTRSNRDGIGARVVATSGKHSKQVREVIAGSSYSSTNSPWPSFGLGLSKAVRLTVHWPSGRVENFGSFRADRKVTLVEGHSRRHHRRHRRRHRRRSYGN